MTLAEAAEGRMFMVTGIASDHVGVQACRFGLEEGALLFVAKNIRGGPVIVCKNQLEIAIGRDIAEAIEIAARP
jgi:Fe2+ transport system protein FeoA